MGKGQWNTADYPTPHAERGTTSPQHLKPKTAAGAMPAASLKEISCLSRPFPRRPPPQGTAGPRWRRSHSAQPASPPGGNGTAPPPPRGRPAPPLPLAPPQNGGRTSCLSARPPPPRPHEPPLPAPFQHRPIGQHRPHRLPPRPPAAANSNKERRASLRRRPTSCAQPFAPAGRPRLAHA